MANSMPTFRPEPLLATSPNIYASHSVVLTLYCDEKTIVQTNHYSHHIAQLFGLVCHFCTFRDSPMEYCSSCAQLWERNFTLVRFFFMSHFLVMRTETMKLLMPIAIKSSSTPHHLATIAPYSPNANGQCKSCVAWRCAMRSVTSSTMSITRLNYGVDLGLSRAPFR